MCETTRICIKCKQEKLNTLEFWIKVPRKVCKTCIALENKLYRALPKNKDKARKANLKWIKENPIRYNKKKKERSTAEYKGDTCKKWNAKNKDKIKQYALKSRKKESTKEQHKIGSKIYRSKHPDRIKKLGDKYRANLSRSYVAGVMRMKTIDLTDEVYEIRKAQILAKRIAGITSYTQELRTCSCCNETKVVTKEFWYSHKDKFPSTQCKVCLRNKQRIYRASPKGSARIAESYSNLSEEQRNRNRSSQQRGYQNHKKERNAKRKIYQRTHKDRIRQRFLELEEKIPEGVRKFKNKIKNSINVQGLSQSYIASTMNISVEDMSNDLYNLKKANIKLKREILCQKE